MQDKYTSVFNAKPEFQHLDSDPRKLKIYNTSGRIYCKIK